MKLNILIGGKAGQGINKVSLIISSILTKYGYFTFNYREYPSLIRGGHNFNILSISDKKIGSYESQLDFIIALDENTEEIHKKELKKEGIKVMVYPAVSKNLDLEKWWKSRFLRKVVIIEWVGLLYYMIEY